MAADDAGAGAGGASPRVSTQRRSSGQARESAQALEEMAALFDSGAVEEGSVSVAYTEGEEVEESERSAGASVSLGSEVANPLAHIRRGRSRKEKGKGRDKDKDKDKEHDEQGEGEGEEESKKEKEEKEAGKQGSDPEQIPADMPQPRLGRGISTPAVPGDFQRTPLIARAHSDGAASEVIDEEPEGEGKEDEKEEGPGGVRENGKDVKLMGSDADGGLDVDAGEDEDNGRGMQPNVRGLTLRVEGAQLLSDVHTQTAGNAAAEELTLMMKEAGDNVWVSGTEVGDGQCFSSRLIMHMRKTRNRHTKKCLGLLLAAAGFAQTHMAACLANEDVELLRKILRECTVLMVQDRDVKHAFGLHPDFPGAVVDALDLACSRQSPTLMRAALDLAREMLCDSFDNKERFAECRIAELLAIVVDHVSDMIDPDLHEPPELAGDTELNLGTGLTPRVGPSPSAGPASGRTTANTNSASTSTAGTVVRDSMSLVTSVGRDSDLDHPENLSPEQLEQLRVLEIHQHAVEANRSAGNATARTDQSSAHDDAPDPAVVKDWLRLLPYIAQVIASFTSTRSNVQQAHASNLVLGCCVLLGIHLKRCPANETVARPATPPRLWNTSSPAASGSQSAGVEAGGTIHPHAAIEIPGRDGGVSAVDRRATASTAVGSPGTPTGGASKLFAPAQGVPSIDTSPASATRDASSQRVAPGRPLTPTRAMGRDAAATNAAQEHVNPSVVRGFLDVFWQCGQCSGDCRDVVLQANGVNLVTQVMRLLPDDVDVIIAACKCITMLCPDHEISEILAVEEAAKHEEIKPEEFTPRLDGGPADGTVDGEDADAAFPTSLDPTMSIRASAGRLLAGSGGTGLRLPVGGIGAGTSSGNGGADTSAPPGGAGTPEHKSTASGDSTGGLESALQRRSSLRRSSLHRSSGDGEQDDPNEPEVSSPQRRSAERQRAALIGRATSTESLGGTEMPGPLLAAGTSDVILGILKKQTSNLWTLAKVVLRATVKISAFPQVAKRMVAGGAITAIIRCMRQLPFDRDVQGQALQAFINLCQGAPVARSHLARHEGCESIYYVMESFPHDFLLLSKSIDATAAACRDDDVRDTFGRIGMCEKVVAALKELVSNFEMQSRILTCIQNVCGTSESNVERFAKAGICQALRTTVSQYLVDKVIVAKLFNVIRLLCRAHANREQLGNEGFCDIIILSMNTFCDEREVQYEALAAMAKLAAHNSGNQRKLGSVGAPDAIRECLQNFGEDCGVVERCLAAIFVLGFDGTTRKVLGEMGADALVIQELGRFPKNYAVQYQGTGAVWTLSLNLTNMRAQLGRGGACTVLCNALRTFRADPKLVLNCCEALVQLSFEPDNIKRLVSLGVIELLARASSDFLSHDSILLKSMEAAANIVSDSAENAALFLNSGGMRIVSNALQLQSQDAMQPVKIRILALLQQLGSFGELSEELVREHAPAQLCEAAWWLRQQREAAERSCTAIQAMCQYPALREDFAQTSVCKLVSFFLYHFLQDQLVVTHSFNAINALCANNPSIHQQCAENQVVTRVIHVLAASVDEDLDIHRPGLQVLGTLASGPVPENRAMLVGETEHFSKLLQYWFDRSQVRALSDDVLALVYGILFVLCSVPDERDSMVEAGLVPLFVEALETRQKSMHVQLRGIHAVCELLRRQPAAILPARDAGLVGIVTTALARHTTHEDVVMQCCRCVEIVAPHAAEDIEKAAVHDIIFRFALPSFVDDVPKLGPIRLCLRALLAVAHNEHGLEYMLQKAMPHLIDILAAAAENKWADLAKSVHRASASAAEKQRRQDEQGSTTASGGEQKGTSMSSAAKSVAQTFAGGGSLGDQDEVVTPARVTESLGSVAGKSPGGGAHNARSAGLSTSPAISPKKQLGRYNRLDDGEADDVGGESGVGAGAGAGSVSKEEEEAADSGTGQSTKFRRTIDGWGDIEDMEKYNRRIQEMLFRSSFEGEVSMQDEVLRDSMLAHDLHGPPPVSPGLGKTAQQSMMMSGHLSASMQARVFVVVAALELLSFLAEKFEAVDARHAMEAGIWYAIGGVFANLNERRTAISLAATLVARIARFRYVRGEFPDSLAPDLIGATRRHRREERVMQPLLLATWWLCVENNLNRKLLGPLGANEEAVHALKNYSSHSEMCKHAMATIWELAKDEDNALRLGQLGAVRRILGIVQYKKPRTGRRHRSTDGDELSVVDEPMSPTRPPEEGNTVADLESSVVEGSVSVRIPYEEDPNSQLPELPFFAYGALRTLLTRPENFDQDDTAVTDALKWTRSVVDKLYISDTEAIHSTASREFYDVRKQNHVVDMAGCQAPVVDLTCSAGGIGGRRRGDGTGDGVSGTGRRGQGGEEGAGEGGVASGGGGSTRDRHNSVCRPS